MSIPLDGTGASSVLALSQKGLIVPSSVSQDGKLLVGHSADAPLWTLPIPDLRILPPNENPQAFLDARFTRVAPALSPDRGLDRISTRGNDTGRYEIYVGPISWPRRNSTHFH